MTHHKRIYKDFRVNILGNLLDKGPLFLERFCLEECYYLYYIFETTGYLFNKPQLHHFIMHAIT